MAPSCGYCGDRECAECGGRPARSNGQPLDEFMQSKAQQAAPQAPQPIAPAPSPVQVLADIAVQQGFQPDPASFAAAEAVVSAPAPYTQRELEIAALGGITLPEKKVRGPRAPRTNPNPAFAAAYSAWQASCIQRKAWIEGFRKQWVEARELAGVEIGKWNAYVAEAKKRYDDANATEPPAAPRKEDFPG